MRDPSPLRFDELVDETPPTMPEHALVRVAKLAGLVTAVAVLCGAIVAAAFLDIQRRGAERSPKPGPATGAQAFSVTTAGVTAGHEPVVQRPAVHPSQEAPWRPAGEQQNDPEAIADGFYRLIDRDPNVALGLLGGSLTDTERQELAVAWRDIDWVRVDSKHVRPDGWVDTVVTMSTVSGERYRMMHRLLVEPPRITEVRLLSAQRLS